MPIPRLLRLFTVILVFAAVFGVFGFTWGSITWNSAETSWGFWRASHGIKDLPAFARVGHVHNNGYLGALVGLIVASVIARRQALRIAE